MFNKEWERVVRKQLNGARDETEQRPRNGVSLELLHFVDVRRIRMRTRRVKDYSYVAGIPKFSCVSRQAFQLPYAPTRGGAVEEEDATVAADDIA